MGDGQGAQDRLLEGDHVDAWRQQGQAQVGDEADAETAGDHRQGGELLLHGVRDPRLETARVALGAHRPTEVRAGAREDPGELGQRIQ